MIQRIKQAVQGTRLYKPLRDSYRFAFNRQTWNHHREMIKFYKQFISENDLVFDVGANNGVYTDVFRTLGAQVVAVEPNPKCAAFLRETHSREGTAVVIENVAIGSQAGQATLHLCDTDTLGSLSQEWIAVASSARRFSGKHWNQTIQVPVTTLDALICKYGMPHFIKIDVEGFEPEVLRGLSQASRLLSFEFNTEFNDATIKSLRSRCFSEKARFNLALNEKKRLILDNWVTADELEKTIIRGHLWPDHTFGDVYVSDIL